MGSPEGAAYHNGGRSPPEKDNVGKDAIMYADERIATQPAYRQAGDDAIKNYRWYQNKKNKNAFYKNSPR